ncbi:hypothetical protein HCN44_011464 [Aphidius gifuensis]|uniref:Replication factor A protein 3 n=1 Tax=Aphidius gifuensis TaxID=684658 RepID=A0A834XY14_APHGI|nr:uncharacterized protein LOC122851591 [Aphidius gifuensis]KAF7994195.1 hypothetical protein HCN44_011464 [Aphidius gifuensis]
MVSRTRVSAKTLGNYINKKVTMIGRVTKISTSRDCIEIDTSEDIKINVSLNEVFEGPLDSIIEVHGTANSKTTISADHYVVFDKEDNADFDQAEYNEFLTIRDFKLGQSVNLREAFSDV